MKQEKILFFSVFLLLFHLMLHGVGGIDVQHGAGHEERQPVLPAHAWVEQEKGRNAIEECRNLAHAIQALDAHEVIADGRDKYGLPEVEHGLFTSFPDGKRR